MIFRDVKKKLGGKLEVGTPSSSANLSGGSRRRYFKLTGRGVSEEPRRKSRKPSNNGDLI